MSRTRPRGLLIALVSGALVCCAPSQVGAQDKLNAEAAYRDRDWPSAIESYRKVLRNDPEDGISWTRLGAAHRYMESYSDAAAAFQRAIDLKYSIQNSYYNLACAHAKDGQKQRALAALEHAIAAGYTSADLIQIDIDLISIRNTPEFRALIKRAEQPVMYYSEGRELSPLSGLWDVSSEKDGKGTMTANVAANGFSRQVDVLLDGSRALNLFMYFVAPDNAWHVAGADSDGGVYEGVVATDGGSVTCGGKRMVSAQKQEIRVRITVDEGGKGRVTKEALSDGEWTAEGTYALGRLLEQNGGRTSDAARQMQSPVN